MHLSLLHVRLTQRDPFWSPALSFWQKAWRSWRRGRSSSNDNRPSIIDFIEEIYQIWVTEKPNLLAAALAYFGMFSFAAVIYIAFRFAGIFINEEAAAERFYTRIASILGSETASFIQASISAISATNTGGSLLITAVSMISLLLAAMGLFLQLKYVLNRIWKVPLIQRGQKFSLIRRYLFAFIMVIALGLLIILGTVVSAALAWFGSIVNEFVDASNLLSILEVLTLLGVLILANAFIYQVLPDVNISWRDVWPGSVAAALLMAIGGVVITLYFRFGGIHSAFDAAGAFAVLMIAIYYFAQIFLIGAIITRVYARRYGSMQESP
jgi:YihY family inner membrane protein